ncbi:MAG: leucine-rich repeat domain-containing protein [Lachnospiraceae bacterium]|nr:leucine-rich repeat domain-containing protein [Lachnospiraceae bacterium]
MKTTKKMAKKLLPVMFTLVMAITLFTGILEQDMSVVQAATLNNPRIDRKGVMTWDCVYFGNYPQSDATGNTKEPIKWRVLSVDGDDVFLVADTNLDVQRYNATDKAVTWETCTMRSWLNGYGSSSNACGIDYTSDNFINRAFTASEQSAIKTVTVVTAGNPIGKATGGKDTHDKLFLLSFEEVTNPDYGFSINYLEDDNARLRKNTAYVAAGGAIGSNNMKSKGIDDSWLLRTPGYYGEAAGEPSKCVISMEYCGHIPYMGTDVNREDGVCPALHLSLSSSEFWSYAGTVSSDGSSTEGEKQPEEQKNLMKGDFVADPVSQAVYKVTQLDSHNKTVEYIAPKSKKTNIVIPDKITIDGVGYKVTSIAAKAFENNIWVTKVTIGKNVKTIGDGAFSFPLFDEEKTSKLKTVSMRANVTTINDRAFYGCDKLTKIVIPAKVNRIGKKAFYGCSKLKNITIKTRKLTKKNVGKYAFSFTYSKVTIKVPGSKLNSYKKLLRARGIRSTKAKIKK